MLLCSTSPLGRQNNTKKIDVDLVVIGGGLAGVCAAITAARANKKVCLIQDRPVLGGNASSEVRLWCLGATSHMGNNNRWSREGGLIDEILLENLYKNREGNAVIFDTVLLDKVRSEKNITLLLNTVVHHTVKEGPRKITAVEAFCSQNSTNYRVSGQYFCDASGDGIVAFQAGAAFRVGAEAQDEFGEKLAPKKANTELLGHSLYFYSKDTGAPVSFEPPSYASIDRVTLDRIKRIRKDDVGSRLWWLEYGGNSNTIDDTEEIKWELWKVVYGVWDYIKNSGKFEDVENLTLEWVGTIPGKRESRRFEGHYMLTQQDVVEQNTFYDAVSYGGWSIDHHPGDGVYSDKPPCRQFHSKGVFQIPLRSMISRDMDNLFFAGRIISVSHIAFGSTRVMCTCAHGGQAVGQAVVQCLDEGIKPSALLEQKSITKLQNALNYNGHFIPGVPIDQTHNLAVRATISASSTLELTKLAKADTWKSLAVSAAQLLPLRRNTQYSFKAYVRSSGTATLKVQLRISNRPQNYTPDTILEEKSFALKAGEQEVSIAFSQTLATDQYAFICFLGDKGIELACSEERVTGLVSVFNGESKAVSNTGKQVVDGDIGIDEFEFWIPERRPGGRNIALAISPAVSDFSCGNLINGYTRPYLASNAWVAAMDDEHPEIQLEWAGIQSLSRISLHFDADFDHALESTLMGHPERRIPFCVQNYDIFSDDGKLIHSVKDNYLTVNHILLEQPVQTRKLVIKLNRQHRHIPVSLLGINIQ
jgi:hypothetical protein